MPGLGCCGPGNVAFAGGGRASRLEIPEPPKEPKIMDPILPIVSVLRYWAIILVSVLRYWAIILVSVLRYLAIIFGSVGGPGNFTSSPLGSAVTHHSCRGRPADQCYGPIF